VLLTAKDKYEGGSYNYRDYLKWYEMGLLIGGGYNINDKINVGARAGIGLTNINSEGNNKDHNLLISAIVRYNLTSPFRKK
jgi:hypothetical protein